ncbi:MAG: hypothetical protein H6539_06025 [Bacteroidales bacterium]|nr:hypothetical protein [Bacteroidales bacterium]
MIYLFFSILSSTLLFVIFKFLDKKNIEAFPVIVINYLVAAVCGYILSEPASEMKPGWHIPSAIIGVLFIVFFFIISLSTKRAGISISTVAAKMSVVWPISFSIFYDPNDSLSLVKFAGISLAVISVFLAVYDKEKFKLDPKKIYLPLVLFFGMGIIDSLVKYSQAEFLGEGGTAGFTSILFLFSFLAGVIVIPFRPSLFKSLFQPVNVLWGLFLGICNYGSIYFLLSALNNRNLSGLRTDSSIIFGMNNTGIVALSVLLGVFVFKEKLKPINQLGIIIAMVAIIVFSFA